jgi:hypothetical protein
MNEIIRRFLDDKGRVKQIPAKMNKKILIFEYLATKFEKEIVYTERDVNKIIADWSTTGDYFALRRGLVDSGQLSRTPDGSEYHKAVLAEGDNLT